MARDEITVLGTLADLEAAAAGARQAVADAEGAVARSRRAGERERSALAAYYEAVAAGDRAADGDLERELLAAVDATAGTLRPRFGRDHEFLGVELVDERAEAELRGARRKLEAAERAVAEFAAMERLGLHREQLAESVRARDAVVAAVAALEAADARLLECRKVHARIDRLAGLEVELGRPPQVARGPDFVAFARAAGEDPDGMLPLPVDLRGLAG